MQQLTHEDIQRDGDLHVLAHRTREAQRDLAMPTKTGFRVGALVLLDHPQMLFYCGGNIETSAYTAGICAERTAIVSAKTSAYNTYPVKRVMIYADQLITPCGTCRQFMSDITPDAEVIMLTGRSEGRAEEQDRPIWQQHWRYEGVLYTMEDLVGVPFSRRGTL